jgi:predicted signal transduction protein with EAL and GGDEF domain
MGGDEFLVVTRHYGLEPDSAAIAERVAAALKKPVRLGEATYSATTSIGMSVYPRDATTDELNCCARPTSHCTKRRRAGRDNVQMFDAAMNKRVHTRLALEQDPAQRGQPRCHRDPAPAHRRHPQRPPGVRSKRWHAGTIRATAQCRRWPSSRSPRLRSHRRAGRMRVPQRRAARSLTGSAPGLKPVPVAGQCLGQAAQAFQPSRTLVAIAHEFDIAPHQMEVELTESVAMQDSEQHVTKLHALRDLGVRVSVDDFGTGYSSLAYLRNLPIDYLKIDRTFVRDMNVDRNDAAIVRAIISMAQSLHLGIVAEGIETREHASQLLALGLHDRPGLLLLQAHARRATRTSCCAPCAAAAPMQAGPSLEIVRVS